MHVDPSAGTDRESGKAEPGRSAAATASGRSTKSPSTGNFDPVGKDKASETGTDHPAGPDQTRTSVNGERSPRLPHERDESNDTGNEPPSEGMRIAYGDAVSEKVLTDKSAEADAAYSHLRGRVPGNERDVGRS